MARTLHDAKLDTRTARLKLKARHAPYWCALSQGMNLGYRKGTKGGTWLAKHSSPDHGRRQVSLGTSDDIMDADGVHIFSFSQAQEAARKWFADLARQDAGDYKAGPYSVREVMADYLTDYKRRGGKGLYIVETTINAHINSTLGDMQAAKLTRKKIEDWHTALTNKPPRVRSKKGEEQQYRELAQDDDAIRRRRSTANRVLTLFKAALNNAYHRGHIANSDAWEAVKPFRETDAAKIRYLTDKEATRLVNVCGEDLRGLVTAALLTGARYSELTALKASDFNSDSGTIQIGRSKSGKARHIVLTDEGKAFFKQATAGKSSSDITFLKSSGVKWQHADQYRQMNAACEKAKITPAIGFHILRHTYASRLAMKGVPMQVIAIQLGHSDTRMTEKHYAHLAPSYVADTIRAAFGDMGITKKSNVTNIER